MSEEPLQGSVVRVWGFESPWGKHALMRIETMMGNIHSLPRMPCFWRVSSTHRGFPSVNRAFPDGGREREREREAAATAHTVGYIRVGGSNRLGVSDSLCLGNCCSVW